MGVCAMLKKKWIITLLCVVLVVAGAIVLFCALFNNADYQVQIALSGERVVVVERGGDFADPGASATLIHRGKATDTQIAVTALGDVDTDTIGVYRVSYVANYKNCTGTAYRNIKVVDPEKPVITVYPDFDPTEPGEYEFTATDNFDGDITDRVQRVECDGVITYMVSDSAGNTTTVNHRTFNSDTVAPKISLKGYNTVILELGGDYEEAGYVAVDNRDGDLTDKVSVSGSYNMHKPGRYALDYTVIDSAGNTATKTRVIFVRDPSVTQINDPNKGGKIIYLTFDDGPGADTGRLLDVLAKYNVPATFFVVNTRYIDTIKRTAAEGHVVAIHSVTHVFREIYASEEAYFTDLYTMQAIIKQHTGKTANLIRFPGGGSNTVSRFNKGIMTRLARQVEEKGFVYFDWNVDSGDAGGAWTTNSVFQNVVVGVSGKPEAVVLMHDIKSYSVDAVERIILWGLESGYTFRALTETSPTCHHRINN